MSENLFGFFKKTEIVDILKSAGYTKNEIDMTIKKLEDYMQLLNDISSEIITNRGSVNIVEFITKESENLHMKKTDIAVFTFFYLAVLKMFDMELLGILTKISMDMSTELN